MKTKEDYLSNWITQVRKGLLDYCILKLLIQKEKYGYQLIKELECLPNLIVTEGTVYPILSKLKKEGFLLSELKDSGVGPIRRYYSISEKGQEMEREMTLYWNLLNQSIEKLNTY